MNKNKSKVADSSATYEGWWSELQEASRPSLSEKQEHSREEWSRQTHKNLGQRA